MLPAMNALDTRLRTSSLSSSLPSSPWRRSRRRSALPLLLATVLVATGAAGAEDTMRFEPIGVYLLELDGKVVEGVKMFHSSQAAAVLVVAPQLPYPIAVVPRNKTVQKLNTADLKTEPLGSMVWTPQG